MTVLREVDRSGKQIPNNLAKTFTYTATGKVATISMTDGTTTWTRTFTYDGSDYLTNDSEWVRS